jgi:hypothetical protein
LDRRNRLKFARWWVWMDRYGVLDTWLTETSRLNFTSFFVGIFHPTFEANESSLASSPAVPPLSPAIDRVTCSYVLVPEVNRGQIEEGVVVRCVQPLLYSTLLRTTHQIAAYHLRFHRIAWPGRKYSWACLVASAPSSWSSPDKVDLASHS